jgi:5-methylcytosine-specific restriction endonuclease McrA
VLATRRARYARKSAKRRGALTGHRLTIADLGRRDGWSCHLCGDDIEAELPAAHRWGATLDHVVALAAGGLDVASNLRLAHRSCNSARGSRSVQDYLLAA